ncbi:MAG: AMP-binding protein [Sphingopyxis sp.]|uniref:AMP-binding protein n=1 Tax=Sphingopyxis sp. TaxID=1908224 RepID=UPI002AB91F76|nr:AMP-binding protein [Sphingopyxis sp.]MDZ3833538.1 AMP-binding protein [Sphingopyxis sp.]
MALNFGDILDAVAQRRATQPALSSDDGDRTWAEFDARTNALARGLSKHGIATGDKICFLLFNGAPYVELLAACFKGRFVHVNANFRYTTAELQYILENSDSTALVYDRRLADVVGALDSGLRKRLLLIEAGQQGNDGPVRIEGARDFEAFLSGHDPRPLGIARSADDLLFIYTGGTTGMPKGVMWPHQSLALGLFADFFGRVEGEAQLADWMILLDTPRAYLRPLIASPLMHGTGLLAAITTMCNGGHIVVTDNAGSFDAARHWDLVQRHRADAIGIVGDAFARPLLAAFDAGCYDASSLRLIGSSGVMWSADVKQALLDRIPAATLFDSLGSSEAMNLGSSITARGGDSGTSSFGIGDGCKVFDDDLNEVQPGSGKIGFLARPGALPLGYYKDSEKTAQTFRTIRGIRYSVPGDMCMIEADGTITLLGRGSGCINSGGEKIFPEEIEEALKTHPGVDDALVFGIEDPKWGQAVHAVVRRNGASGAEEEALKTFLADRLARYKLPKRMRFTERSLRLANGKADYRLARSIDASG